MKTLIKITNIFLIGFALMTLQGQELLADNNGHNSIYDSGERYAVQNIVTDWTNPFMNFFETQGLVSQTTWGPTPGSYTYKGSLTLSQKIAFVSDYIACPGETITLTVTPNGGTPPHTITWYSDPGLSIAVGSGPSIDAYITNPVTYYVRITDTNGVSSIQQVVVEIDVPSIDTAPECDPAGTYYILHIFSNSDGNIVTSNIGQIVDLGIPAQWKIINIPLDSCILVTITSPTGCAVTEEYCAPDCSPPCDLSVALNDGTICEGDSLTLTPQITGGSAPYSFAWSNGATTPSITVFPATTTDYEVVVTDSLDCTATANASVMVIAQPEIVMFEAICADDSLSYSVTFTVTHTSTSTAGGQTFNGSGEFTVSGVSLDESITITASNECGETSAEVTPPNCTVECDLTVVINDISICQGDTTILTALVSGGTAPFTYLWNPGGETTSSITVSPDVTTQYFVEIMDDAGCEATDSAIVTVLNLPETVIDTVYCGPENGMYTVEFTVTGSTAVTANGDAVTGPPYRYTTSLDTPVTLIASNECGETTVEVSPPDDCQPCDLTVLISVDGSTICLGDTATLTATASGGTTPFTYNWTPGGETTSSIMVSPTSTTQYLVEIMDSLGCMAIDSATVTVINLPEIVIDSVYCGPENGMYTVEFTVAGSTTVTANGDAVTGPPYRYTASLDTPVTLIASNECGETTVEVSPPDDCQPCDLTVLISVDGSTICLGDTATLTATASGGTTPFTYNWTPGGETTSSIMVSPTATTQYLVEIMDSLGCMAIDSATVTVTNLPEIVVDSVYCGPENGMYTVEFTVTGSTTVTANGDAVTGPPYRYTTSLDTPVTLIASNECGETTVEVSPPDDCQPCDLTVLISVDGSTICLGDTATLTATASGGTVPFTYNWTPGGETTSSIMVSPTATTQYLVEIMDSLGCMAIDSATVTVINLPEIVIDSVYCGPENGMYTVEFTVTGSTTVTANGDAVTGPPYRYTTSLDTPVTLIASNECGETTVEVSPPDDCGECDMTVSIENATICRGDSVTLTAVVSGGTAPFTYSWSPGGETTSSITVTPNVTTQYSIIVSDAEDCTAVDSATVTVVNVPVILTNAIFCGPEIGFFTIQFSVQNAAFVTINGNEVSLMPTYSYTTTLDSTIKIEAGNLCDTTFLEVDAEFLECCDLAVTLNDTIICAGGLPTLTPIVTGGDPDYIFSWFDNPEGVGSPLATTPTFMVPGTGTYYVFVDDQDPNCPGVMDSSTVIISELPLLTVDTVYCGPGVGFYTVEFSTQNESFVIVNGNDLPLISPYSYTTTLDSTIKIEVGNICDTLSAMVNSDSLSCCDLQVTLLDTIICNDVLPVLTPLVTGGEPAYTYAWYDNPDGTGPPLGTASTFLVPAEGTYYVFVDDEDPNCPGVVDSSLVTLSRIPEIPFDSLYCGPESGFYTLVFTANYETMVTINGVPVPVMDTYTYTTSLDSNIQIMLNGPCGTLSTTKNPDNLNCCDLTVSVQDTTVCLAEPTMLTAMVEGGTPPFTYLWSNDSITPSITVIPTTTINYSVTVTDADSCTTVGTATITVLRPPSLTMISTVCSPDSMSYMVTFSSVNATNVLTSAGTLVSTGNMHQVTDIPLTETVTITASNSCGSVSLPIDPPDCTPCDISVSLPDTTICVRDQFILSPVITNGLPEYSYNWSTGETTAEILVFPAVTTTYTVTVTDAENCTATASAMITVNPIPRIRLDSVICSEDDLNYLVYVSTLNADAVTVSSTGTILVEGPPSYTIEVPNDSTLVIYASNECGVDSLQITNTGCPNCNLTAAARDTTICPGDTAQLEVVIPGGSAGYDISWFDNVDCEGDPLSTDTILVVSPEETTTYYVMVIDPLIDSCMVKIPATVNIKPDPAILLNSVICLDDDLNYQVMLTAFNTNILTTSIGELDASAAPVYILTIPNDSTVTIVAFNECSSDTLEINPPPPCPHCNLLVQGAGATICPGETTELSVFVSGANGNYTIEWFDNEACDGDPLSTDSTLIVTVFETTTYYVMVADTTLDSCMVKFPLTVTVLPNPEIIIDNVVCAQDSLNYLVTLTANNTDSLITSIGLIDVSTVPVYTLVIPIGSMVTVIGFNECGSDTVVVNPPPCIPCDLMAMASDTTICAGDEVQLEVTITGSGDYDIGWFDNEDCEGDPLSTETTLIVMPLETTTYYVMVSDSLLDDCFVKVPVTVTVIDLPVIIIDTVYCAGDDQNYIIEFRTTGAEEVMVSAGTLDDSGAPMYRVTVTNGISVTITASNACGSAATEVEPADCPTCLVDILTSDTLMCAGDLLVLQAISLTTDPIQDFKWYDSPDFEGDSLGIGPEITIMPVSSTVYYVVLTTAEGLTCKDSVSVEITPIIFSDGPVCAADSTFFSVDFMTNSENVMVTVSEGDLSGGEGSYTVTNIPSDAQVEVSVIDTVMGCMLDTMFTAPVCCTTCLQQRDIKALVDGKEDGTTIHFGMEVQLDVQMDAADDCTFNWSGPAAISDPSAKNPLFSPVDGLEPAIYTFTVDVTRNGECCPTLRDTVSVCVIPLCEAAVFVPNAFSPNGDNLNDIFRIRAADIDEVKLVIYNRWGEKIKELNSITDTWDGTYGGKTLPSDVYGYYLEARCINGEEIFRKGNITLLK